MLPRKPLQERTVFVVGSPRQSGGRVDLAGDRPADRTEDRTEDRTGRPNPRSSSLAGE